MTNDQLVDVLRGMVPVFAPEVDRHVKSNAGEPIQNYALIGDLFDFAVTEWRRLQRQPENALLKEQLQQIFAFVEYAIACGDTEVVDMVCIEFPQAINIDDDYGKDFVLQLGPKSRQCYEL